MISIRCSIANICFLLFYLIVFAGCTTNSQEMSPIAKVPTQEELIKKYKVKKVTFKESKDSDYSYTYYDKRGLEVKTDLYFSFKGNVSRKISTFEYDLDTNGSVLHKVEKNEYGTVERWYKFDSINRKIESKAKHWNGDTSVTTYTYDDELKTMTETSDSKKMHRSVYHLDNQGLTHKIVHYRDGVKNEVITFEFDENGFKIAENSLVMGENERDEITNNERGQEVKRAYGGSETCNYRTYDERGLLTRYERSGSTPVVIEYSYEYWE